MARAVKARLQQISERVWVYGHDPARLEPAVGLVLTGEGWIVVDSGNSPTHGLRVFEACQTIKERPVRYVINTHRHFDHVFGNQAFRGATIIASRRCQERFARNLKDDWAPERVQRWLREAVLSKVPTLDPDDFERLRPVPPALGFEGEMTLELGEVPLKLFPLAGAHSDDSIGVYLPRERVLILSDALYFHEGPEARFLKLLRLLDYLAPLEVDVYVPGHEAPHGRATFEALRAYVRELAHGVKALLRRGASERDVLDALPFDKRYEGVSFLSPRLHRRLVQAAYRELSLWH